MVEPIEVHTSDRILFKRCRRKWGWQSRLRDNYVAIGQASGPLWFGSGFHFAMEDFYGHKRWPTPWDAFQAYAAAFRESQRPADYDDLMVLGEGMLTYFTQHWLPRHPDQYRTLVINGIPQVEVDVHIDITRDLVDYAMAMNLDAGVYEETILGGRHIVYSMTFDRVCEDDDGRIWGLDYKTAKQFDIYNLVTHPQAAAYDWGLDLFYGRPVEGIIWQQFMKAVPDAPTKLVNGGFSQNKNQYTTYSIYRAALMDHYGKIPRGYVEFLNMLASQETEEGDRFIRRDLLRRNPEQRRAEHRKIIAEVADMLNPNLPLYPNPTRDCSWDCPFRAPCIALDDGSEIEYIFRTEYVQHQGYDDSWRSRIKFPNAEEVLA